MRVCVKNSQRKIKVEVKNLSGFANRAVKKLNIRTPGVLDITLVGKTHIKKLNKQFLNHPWETDVLSFRYNPASSSSRNSEKLLGDILIAPAMAKTYAKNHGIPFKEELSRYVAHGILHWKGQDDRTKAEQKQMRKKEDSLLTSCLK